MVESIDQAIEWEVPICTMGLTNSDKIIETRYSKAKRLPKATELEAYQSLRRGECGLVAAYKDNWEGYKGNQLYNPECDLEWVGRVVETIKSGFATKADAGHLCSSLIRDVLNVHMTELIDNGELQKAWTRHRAKTNNNDCLVETADRRRKLGERKKETRRLKGGSKSAAAAATGAGGTGTTSLTTRQMLGTFALHWFSMFVAVWISLVTAYYEKRVSKTPSGENEIERITTRTHGPIIGSPPNLNTSVKRSVTAHHSTRRYSGSWDEHASNPNSKYRRDIADTGLLSCEDARFEVGQAVERDESVDEDNYTSVDWRRSHANLQRKQEDLANQMNSVMTLLQQMRMEQQQLLRQQRQLRDDSFRSSEREQVDETS